MNGMPQRFGVALLLVALLLPGLAAGFDKPGTTAATFLQIMPGSRVPAMGGAGVALAGGAEMLAINPAAIASDRFSASFAYNDWFAGLEHQTLAVSAPVRPNLRVGIHAISFGGDEFEQTTLEMQNGNGVMVDYGDLAVGASAIMQLTDRFTVGVTGKYIRQDLFHTSAQTGAVDVGTLLHTTLDGFSIGMAMTNLGGDMQLTGQDLIAEAESEDAAESRLHTSKWPLPLTFQFGFGWRLVGEQNAFWQDDIHEFTLAVDSRHLNEGVTTVHAGGEYGLYDIVFLRGGHSLNHDTEEWAFGGGVRVNLHSLTVDADFAYADMGDLNSVKRVTLSIRGR
ncbi:PorV/PorQ family protein [bacterium]|nr:PorV/PorQ family protein [bacterium]